MEKLAYSVKEAAAVLGVSTSAVYNLIHREDFPSLTVGGRRLISKELLSEWVKKEASKGRTDARNEGYSPAQKETRSQF